MADNVLERLLSEDLQANACAYSTGSALHLFLTHRPEVHEVEDAFRQGVISEDAVRDFVASLLKDLRQGVLFPHDRALAALAVALKSWPPSFAEAVLCELAGLKLAEMPLSSRVAHEVLTQRGSRLSGQARGGSVPGPTETTSTQPAQPPSSS